MDNNNADLPFDVSDHMAGSEVTGRGYLTGPGLSEYPVEYAVVDGLAIHEGCIELGTAEAVAAEAAEIAAAHHLQSTTLAAGNGDGNATAEPSDVQHGIGLPQDSRFLWPKGRVAYSIDASVPNQQRVDDAIAHIEQNTAIRFVRRTAANASAFPNYIDIISNGSKNWSSSLVGMRGIGRQLVRLADGHPWPILVHEFLHALGVYHEQSRSDRDDFVEIKWDNILDGPPPPGEMNALGNFQKKPDAVDYFAYDYGSLMHYRSRSFAKDASKPTIVPRQSGVTIGQRDGMSFGDRQTIAKMYERFFPRGYAGVWRSGSGPYGLWVNASWNSFIGKWQEWSNQGLRLVDLHVRQTFAGPRLSGTFLPGTGAYGLWANVSWDSFIGKWQEWSNQGLRLHDLHVHQVNGQNRYSGVFLPGRGGHALWANVSWDSFKAKWQEWSNQGLRLHDLHVHQVNGQNRYSGVFLPGRGGHALWANASWGSFVAKWQEWSNQGLRLADLNLHRSGRDTRYSGVFLPGSDAYYLWANVTYDSFVAKWQELAGQGLRLIDFEFVNPSSTTLFDASDPTEPDDAVAADDVEAFGGIFEGATAAGEPVDEPVTSGGGLHLGQPAPAEQADGDSGGGVDLHGIEVTTATIDQEGEVGGLHLSGDDPPVPSATSGHGAAYLPDSAPDQSKEPTL